MPPRFTPSKRNRVDGERRNNNTEDEPWRRRAGRELQRLRSSLARLSTSSAVKRSVHQPPRRGTRHYGASKYPCNDPLPSTPASSFMCFHGRHLP